MYMYIYVCIYIYVYIYIRTYLYIHTYICTCRGLEIMMMGNAVEILKSQCATSVCVRESVSYRNCKLK